MPAIISRRNHENEIVNVTHMPRHIMDAKGIWFELVLYVHTDGKPCYKYMPFVDIEKMFKK
jgi:hypothetical protein